MTAVLIASIYFSIPVVSIWISGRQITWRGWVMFLFLWPVAWLIFGPEELP